MNILLVNKYSSRGGAAIAAFRQYEALKQTTGINVKFLVHEDGSNADIVLADNAVKKQLAFATFAGGRLYDYMHLQNKNDKFAYDSATFGVNLKNNKFLQWADLIHLHWLHFGFFSLKTLNYLLSLGKPIVWTLHDQWAMTGGCFYPGECEGYLGTCINCPMLKTNLAAKVFSRKQQIYAKTGNLHFIAISSWMKNEINKSKLLSGFPVESIPNAIDTEKYKPLDKNVLAKELGLDPERKRIGFVAFNVADKRKGAIYLKEALKILQNKLDTDKYEVLVIGKQPENDFFDVKFRVTYTGYITSQQMMIKYYNLMDVFVIPSLQDNLPNTAMEALACGIPVVGFNIGGIPDMVDHRQNGYLAAARDSAELAQGIAWVLEEGNPILLRSYARQKVTDNFSYEAIGKRLTGFYTKLLKGNE